MQILLALLVRPRATHECASASSFRQAQEHAHAICAGNRQAGATIPRPSDICDATKPTGQS
jgi:hypothetical protein